jgi:hypothetical protein
MTLQSSLKYFRKARNLGTYITRGGLEMSGTNTLAYYKDLQITDVKRLITSTPGPNLIKPFPSVIYEFLQKARVFVPGKLFQPSLMFVTLEPTLE